MKEKANALAELESACFMLAHFQRAKDEKRLAKAEERIAKLLGLTEDELKEVREGT